MYTDLMEHGFMWVRWDIVKRQKAKGIGFLSSLLLYCVSYYHWIPDILSLPGFRDDERGRVVARIPG